ncbi:PDZ domain-containing protein [Dyella sp. 2RAB6]|uniref:PDZ domain-containing protein n=1 Tax=Dyella sp. 2RAB6 TaxID=3232992 RepID=UPI003F8E31CC
MKARNTLWLCVVLLSGCVSDYAKFYRPENGVTPETIAKVRANPPTATPLVDHFGGTAEALYTRYDRAGYMSIGYSSFNGSNMPTDAQAQEQAVKLQADLVVVVDPKYTGIQSMVVPVLVPTATTSYTSGMAKVVGSDGSATAYGHATTTTYGSQTIAVPVTTARFDYAAVFLIKRKYAFGALFRQITDEERKAVQTNGALEVKLVVDGTPAFKADIFPGDIIVSVDGQPLSSSETEHLFAPGKLVKLKIYRDGTMLEKTVQLAN